MKRDQFTSLMKKSKTIKICDKKSYGIIPWDFYILAVKKQKSVATFVDIVTAIDLYYICIVISWGRVVFYRGTFPWQ